MDGTPARLLVLSYLAVTNSRSCVLQSQLQHEIGLIGRRTMPLGLRISQSREFELMVAKNLGISDLRCSTWYHGVLERAMRNKTSEIIIKTTQPLSCRACLRAKRSIAWALERKIHPRHRNSRTNRILIHFMSKATARVVLKRGGADRKKEKRTRK